MKAEPLEELGDEGEDKDSGDTKVGGLFEATADEETTEALSAEVLADGDRFHLGESFPGDLEGGTTEDVTVAILGDEVIAEVVIEVTEGTREHLVGLGISHDECADLLDVGDPGLANGDFICAFLHESATFP
jgi:hypothetical protein